MPALGLTKQCPRLILCTSRPPARHLFVASAGGKGALVVHDHVHQVAGAEDSAPHCPQARPRRYLFKNGSGLSPLRIRHIQTGIQTAPTYVA